MDAIWWRAIVSRARYRWERLSIGHKVGAGSLVVILALAFSALFVLLMTARVERLRHEGYRATRASMLNLHMRGDTEIARDAVREYLLVGAESDRGRANAAFVDYRGDVSALKAVLADEPELAVRADEETRTIDRALADGLIKELQMGLSPTTRPLAVAMTISRGAALHRQIIDRALERMADDLSRYAGDLSSKADVAALEMQIAVLAGSFFAAIVAGIMAYYVKMEVTAPLLRVAEDLNGIAEGKGVANCRDARRLDEIGLIARAAGDLNNALNERRAADERSAASAQESSRAVARESQSRADYNRTQNEVVERLALALNRLSAGDLSVMLASDIPPAYTAIRDDFNVAIEVLRTAIKEVAQTISSVQGRSAQVLEVSARLAAQSEKQATMLREGRLRLAVVTDAVRTTADAAGKSRIVVDEAQQSTARSEETIAGAARVMREVEGFVSQIGRIADAIEEIARQTNLLSLNASIEAARVSDNSSFSVVANEVRGLAQTASQRSVEIRALVTRSDRTIGNVLARVAEITEVFGTISGQIGTVALHTTAIAVSADAQATSLTEISSSSDELDLITDQTSAMANDLEQAARELAEEGRRLFALASRFTV